MTELSTEDIKEMEPGLLSWEVRENEIVFSLGDWRIRIPKDEFLTLIDPRSLFERFQEAGRQAQVSGGGTIITRGFGEKP